MEAGVTAYKFLAPGAVGPFTGFRWAVGEWVEAEGPLDPCVNGVHAVTTEDLAAWLHEELWRIELDGETVAVDGVLVGRRGRLAGRVEGWNPGAAREFARACAGRARAWHDVPAAARYAADAATFAERASSARDAAEVGYVSAVAAAYAEDGGFAAERARQASWLAERLGL